MVDNAKSHGIEQPSDLALAGRGELSTGSVGPASDGLSDVAQMLERELAAERIERREEVGFLTKMHEREMDLMKSRASSAARQLEEERQLFERHSGTLETRLVTADSRLESEAKRTVDLEEEMTRRTGEAERLHAELEHARAALRGVELDAQAAGQAATQSMVLAHEADRRSDREGWHREMHALGEALARAEQFAQDGAREEQVAHHNVEVLSQALRSAEQTTWAAEQLQAECQREIAAEALEFGRMHALSHEAQLKVAELEEQAEAEGRQVQRALDAIAAEESSLKEIHTASAILQTMAAEKQASLSRSLCLASHESKSEQDTLLLRRVQLDEALVVSRQKTERLQSDSARFEQIWSNELFQEREQLDRQNAGHRDLHGQLEEAVRQKCEAATTTRLEVGTLHAELADIQRWGHEEAEEAARRHNIEADLKATTSSRHAAASARDQIVAERQQHMATRLGDLEAALGGKERASTQVRADLVAANGARSRDREELRALRACTAGLEGQLDLARSEWVGRLRAAEAVSEAAAEAARAAEVDRRGAEGAARGRAEDSQRRTDEALREARAEAARLAAALAGEQRRAAQLEGQLRAHLDAVDREVAALRAKGAAMASLPGASQPLGVWPSPI